MIPVGADLRLKGLPWVTLTLAGLNWVVFLFDRKLDHETYILISYLFWDIPGEFQPWTWITHAFFHDDLLHILFNSLFLLVFGPPVEERIGRKDFLFLYLLTAVAASLVHTAMTGLFLRQELFVSSLGASGAISGVMGVYLNRCYYLKVKLLINPFIPIDFRVPAYLLLPIWFLQDFAGGIDAIRGIESNVAFWSHVGGFLGGFGASAYLRYHLLAKQERLQFVAETGLEEFAGYGRGMEALKKLLEEDSENVEYHLGLARAMTRWRASEEGRIHYEKAIRLLLETDPEKAGEVFIEFWGKYLRLLEPPVQLRLSLLIERSHPDLSAITLQSLIDSHPPEGLPMEEAHLQLARIYQRTLRRTDLARRVYERFLERFPESENREYAQKALDRLEVRDR